MQTSAFINGDSSPDKIETLGIEGAKSRTFKRRIEGRLYFMKLLRAEYNADSRYHSAFFKEYEVGKSISSPYVVKYVGIENNSDGLYILMEYVNGITVEEKLAAEPEYFHNPRNIRKLLVQLSRALEALHEKGIVHLDIKPENVMLTKTTNDVVLVDLGLCLSNTNDTTAGCTKGFAAPETIAGDICEIDARSDIYSVGCLLQYIEEKSGSRFGYPYGRIIKRCMQPVKKMRYSCVGDIVDSIRTGRIIKFAKAITLAVVMLLACIIFPGPQLYDDVKNYMAWEFGDMPGNFEADGLFYRISDHEHRTVEVTYKGNHPDEFEYEYKGGEVEIPPTVTFMGREFSVTSIAGQTFKNPYIYKVNIPQGILAIKDSAFIYCNQTGVISIPQSVEYIGLSVFYPMLYIDGFVVHADNPYYDSREGCNAIIETATNSLIAGCNNTVIPYGVERIAANAFVGAVGLDSITIPETVREIGANAFVRSGITSVELPEGIMALEQYTFQYCSNLQRVMLPKSLKSIGLAALSHCSFKELVIPDSVSVIGDYAFDYSERLESVTVGCGVRSIGYAAFDGCKRLVSVTSRIPAENLFEIDNTVFGNIDKDCILYVPRGAKKVYSNTYGWDCFADIVEIDM